MGKGDAIRPSVRSVTPGDLPPGFEFRSVIGSGGGGWVSLARQTALDRDVAVKTVLVGDQASPAMQRLQREGRVLAGLDHRGIVRIHQMITHRSALFLVMEYLPGVVLDRALKDWLPVAQMLAVLADVAGALQTVHRQGIAHRDIKPANIILHPTRGAVLLDFGLARLPLARSTFRSEIGTATGTPRYMAPEQIDQPDAATPAIDSYAFGVLAFQMLLGEYPYRSGVTLADIVRAHRAGTPTDPRELAPRLAPDTAALMVRAMDKNPVGRPAPAELIAALIKTPAEHWPLAARATSAATSAAASALGRAEAEIRQGTTLSTQTGVADPSEGLSSEDGGRPTGAADRDLESTAAVPVLVTNPVDGALPAAAPPPWVAPLIYRPPRARRRPIRPQVLIACAIGLLVGIVLVGLWLR